MLRFCRLDVAGALGAAVMTTAVLISAIMISGGASAQNFTTAAEVRPILTATKPNWIAVREYDGQDLLYFTNLLAWRCGVTSLRYQVNGNEPVDLVIEPCHEDTAQPNALLMETIQPYLTFPLASIATVTLEVTYDDASTDTATYERKSVLTP